MNTKHLTKGIVVILLLFITSSIYAQTYREIKGWSKEINERIETFLNTTLTMNIRKVAVFDGDGTVIGQAHTIWRMKLYIVMPINIIRAKMIRFPRKKWLF